MSTTSPETYSSPLKYVREIVDTSRYVTPIKGRKENLFSPTINRYANNQHPKALFVLTFALTSAFVAPPATVCSPERA